MQSLHSDTASIMARLHKLFSRQSYTLHLKCVFSHRNCMDKCPSKAVLRDRRQNASHHNQLRHSTNPLHAVRHSPQLCLQYNRISSTDPRCIALCELLRHTELYSAVVSGWGEIVQKGRQHDDASVMPLMDRPYSRNELIVKTFSKPSCAPQCVGADCSTHQSTAC
jgi:hypothetical protein